VKSIDAHLDLTGATSLTRKGIAYVLAIFDYAMARVSNMQLEKLKAARDLGLDLSFVEIVKDKSSAVPTKERLATQTPRAFYRRESEEHPLIVAKIRTTQ